MATANTIAKAIVGDVGYNADPQVLGESLQRQLVGFGADIMEAIATLTERVQAPVSWRQALVISHHGIPQDSAKKFTKLEYRSFLSELDHSECQSDYLDDNGEARRGCPVKMGRLEVA